MFFCSVSGGPYYILGIILSCEDGSENLHKVFTVNMAVVNYFGTQIPEIGGKMKIDLDAESADLCAIDLTEYKMKDHCIVADVLL